MANYKIEKSQVFGLSPNILKQFVKRSGTAVFTVHNPENKAEYFLGKSQNILGSYLFVDPFEDVESEKEKEMFIGRNFENPTELIIENELTVDIENEYSRFMFLMLHPANGSNKYRKDDTAVRFWLKPEIPVSKNVEIQNDLLNTVCDTIYSYFADEKLHHKLVLASNVIASKNKRYVVTKSDTPAMHKKNLLNFAKGNELELYKALNDDRGQKLEMVFTALTSSAIHFNVSKAMWQFSDYDNSYLKVEVAPTEDRFEKLVDHLIADSKAYDKLKEMLGL